MKLLLLSGYKKIYAVDSFWEEYQKLFGKDLDSYVKEKEVLLTRLQMLDGRPLSELLRLSVQFERLSNEDLYVIRHVSKRNPRVIFVTSDEEGNVVLLNSFLEKKRGDYEIAKNKARERMKLLQ